MNRAGYSLNCIVCGLDFHALLFETGSYSARARIHRQISNGICDADQRLRYAAAISYERASSAVRMVTEMGATWSAARPPKLSPVLREAHYRLEQANRECVRLKMWPANREETQ